MYLKKAKKDNKSSPKDYGPHKVLQNIATITYKLELPPSFGAHPAFHVSCLKKVIGDKLTIQTMFLELDKEGKITFKPQEFMEMNKINLFFFLSFLHVRV